MSKSAQLLLVRIEGATPLTFSRVDLYSESGQRNWPQRRMTRSPNTSVSELLIRLRNGDSEALSVLVPLVYTELRRLAHAYLQRQSPGHTLQSTGLVHELYLKLVDMDMDWQNRAHFFGVAARVMRGILVDHARGQHAKKRGGGALRISLAEDLLLQEQRSVDLMMLDDTLKQLAALDPRQGQIVELKFFGGLSNEETAEAIGVSAATVKREWALARAWIYRKMGEGA